MDRKLLNNLDGFAVDEYAATFTGSFEVRGADARYLAYDDEVLLVVRARVKPPRLKEMKSGDIVRMNVLGIKDGAVVRSDELKTHLCDTLGLDMPMPQLSFDDLEPDPAVQTLPEPELETRVDPEPEVVEELAVVPSEPQTIRFNPTSGGKDDRLAAFLNEGA